MLKKLFKLSLFLFVMTATGLVAMYYYLVEPYLPNLQEISDIKLSLPMQVYSADNKLFAEFGEQKRYLIDADNIPDKIKASLLTVEDSRFYEHIGIDFSALVRAAIALVVTGEKSQGGSTITMQLARNFFLTREKSFLRKIRELFLALKIESVYSKDEILTLYMNRIFLGHRSYGFEAASLTYFGKSLHELSWAESALLAALPKAPSSLNPISFPERAKQRRDLVLGILQEKKIISEEEYQSAILEPIFSRLNTIEYDLNAGHVAEMARTLSQKYLPEVGYEDGIKIYTTIQSDRQNAANQAVKDGLIRYIRRSGWQGPEIILPIDYSSPTNSARFRSELITLTQRIENIPGFQRGIIFEKTTSQVINIQLENAQIYQLQKDDVTWAETTWQQEESDLAKAQAILDQYQEDLTLQLQQEQSQHYFIPTLTNHGKHAEARSNALPVGGVVYLQATSNEDYQLVSRPEVQAALVSMDVTNGAIQALVGGFNFINFKFNRVIQARRQPGSSFKAFLYTVGLINGMTPATTINDTPIVYEDNSSGLIWTPKNYSEKYFGPTRLRLALTRSRNLVSVRLAERMGVNSIIEQLSMFGFEDRDFDGNRNLSLSLGSAPVSPLKVARGFSVIANGGHLIEPYIIQRIEDDNGNILYQHQPKVVCYQPCNDLPEDQLATRTLDERVAFIMYDMLGDVVRYGTARKALALKRKDLGGKTGTTNDQIDAWFSGFNRQLATTVWVGNDDPKPMGSKETGSQSALPIWIDYMKTALVNIPESLPPQPNDIVQIRISKKTGKPVVGSNTENTMLEMFLSENAPSIPTAPTNGFQVDNENTTINQSASDNKAVNNSTNDLLNKLYQ